MIHKNECVKTRSQLLNDLRELESTKCDAVEISSCTCKSFLVVCVETVVCIQCWTLKINLNIKTSNPYYSEMCNAV